MTATTTAALVPIQPAFTAAERLALAGFLAGYRGLTRDAYALDLRQFTAWCRNQADSSRDRPAPVAAAVTHRDPTMNANRCYARAGCRLRGSSRGARMGVLGGWVHGTCAMRR
jgi:hypothetical protein